MLKTERKINKINADITSLESLSTQIATATKFGGMDAFSTDVVNTMLDSIVKRHALSVESVSTEDASEQSDGSAKVGNVIEKLKALKLELSPQAE